MIPVWLIAAIALLGAVCLALPLHIGMAYVCCFWRRCCWRCGS